MSGVRASSNVSSFSPYFSLCDAAVRGR
jgi:hypothetical protein